MAACLSKFSILLSIWNTESGAVPAFPLLPHCRDRELGATHGDHKHLETTAPSSHFPQHPAQPPALRTHRVTACGINKKFHTEDRGEALSKSARWWGERGHCCGRQGCRQALLPPPAGAAPPITPAGLQLQCVSRLKSALSSVSGNSCEESLLPKVGF